MKSEKLSIRPYARLLTMLGDQLIKHERIALVELIKNAYDADAEQVEVRFENFNPDMSNNKDSRIIVRDDGAGMTLDVVRNQWMNPAAPQKYIDKQQGRGKTLGKKRVIQGEKGIGRFAVLKLGRAITITTRPREADFETIIDYDFSRFDDDFISEDGQQKDIFLDQIKIDCFQSEPRKLSGSEHGTVIEIRNLKGAWNRKNIDRLCRDVSSLTDPVSRITGGKASDPFEIVIFCNGKSQSAKAKNVETLVSLIEDKPVLDIQGRFDSHKNIFLFSTKSGVEKEAVSMQDSKITTLWVWRKHFEDDLTSAVTQQKYRCGDFTFRFYIFDFSRGIDGRHALIQEEKNLLKEHRIYLYRDGIRVYPYGDPDDDWLNIDVTRGTGRAGDFFSNDQIIGWIDITQQDNPDLRDKTSREGLIETGGASVDLFFLVRTFLSYIKSHPFARYQVNRQHRNLLKSVHAGAVVQQLGDLKKEFKKSGDKPRARQVAKVETEYKREKAYLSRRAEITEDLAGVGLSVEMASHDIMLLMSRAQDIGRQLAQAARKSVGDEIGKQADMLIGVLDQIVNGMQDIQSLFKSSRRRRQSLKVEPVLDKIHQIYRTLLQKRGIHYQKIKVSDSPLVANATDGVVMQVLINLFDNASYWLDTIDPAEREIRVTVDGEQGELIFSDNGPGVDPEDMPYIFEPFYSGKGQEGRGLGLYIARQLLERYGYRIALAKDYQKVLPGTNFVVSFVKEEL